MGKLSVSFARRRLLRISLIGAVVIFSILLFQTLTGKHGNDIGSIWVRYLVLWIPLVATAIGLMFVPAPGHRADRLLLQASKVLIWLYLLGHLAVIMVQPVLNPTPPMLDMIRDASFGLLPAQIILIVLMALMVLKPAGSASETLEGLPDAEQNKIRDAFKPVAQSTRRLIGQNKVLEAIDELLNFCEAHDLPQDELLNLKRWWNDNTRERNNNLISNDEANREEARITNALLEGIKKMGE